MAGVSGTGFESHNLCSFRPDNQRIRNQVMQRLFVARESHHQHPDVKKRERDEGLYQKTHCRPANGNLSAAGGGDFQTA